MSAMEVPAFRKESTRVEESYRYFVGIDWATEKHHVTLLDGPGRKLWQREVEHEAASLRAFFDDMLNLADGQPGQVAVGIETPHGAVVESLVERGFHVYAVNPKQLDRFRDRHTVAGAKDDSLDSYVIGDALRTDRHLYRRVRVDDPLIIRIREMTRASEDLTSELGRLSNQLRENVYRLVPQLLTLSPGADEPWIWDLLDLVSRADPERIRPTQVARILKNNRIRRLDVDQVLTLLRQQAPWTTPGTQQAVRAHIALLLPRLRVALQQSRDCDKQIQLLLDELAAQGTGEGEIREHRDVTIIQSLPGAGTTVTATMLAEASQPLAERDYQTLRANGGVAPVTKSSGKRSKRRALVHMRYACNTRLRNAFFFLARAAVQHDAPSKGYYAELRGRGHEHARALRSVADRLLRILLAMLEGGSLYDPARANKRLCAATTGTP
jgi:transposase